MNTLFAVAYFSTFSPLLPFALSFRIKKITHEIRLVQIITATSFIIDLASFLMARKGINTFALGNLYSLIQSSLLLLIFCDVLNLKRWSVYVTLTFGTAFLANYFFIQGPFVFNSYTHIISAFIFILLALLYFRRLLIELPSTFPNEIPMVWINLAVLVYYSGNLFLFILNNYFIHELKGNEGAIWTIHNSLNIVKNFLFLMAIWQSLRKTNLSSY